MIGFVSVKGPSSQSWAYEIRVDSGDDFKWEFFGQFEGGVPIWKDSYKHVIWLFLQDTSQQ